MMRAIASSFLLCLLMVPTILGQFCPPARSSDKCAACVSAGCAFCSVPSASSFGCEVPGSVSSCGGVSGASTDFTNDLGSCDLEAEGQSVCYSLPLGEPPFTPFPSGSESNAWEIADPTWQNQATAYQYTIKGPAVAYFGPVDAGGVPPSELTAVNVPGDDCAVFYLKGVKQGGAVSNGTRMGVTSVIQLEAGSHAIQVFGPPPKGFQGVFRVFGTAGKDEMPCDLNTEYIKDAFTANIQGDTITTYTCCAITNDDQCIKKEFILSSATLLSPGALISVLTLSAIASVLL